MKQHIPLRRFEYCAPPPRTPDDGMQKVSIDFEKKELSVTGDIRRVPDRSRKQWWRRSSSPAERIEVRATICPGFTGGLEGFLADKLIFSLEGTMRDRRRINACSGLLVLENLTGSDESEDQEWYATLYLYDDKCDGREIKLRLTMYCTLVDPELN